MFLLHSRNAVLGSMERIQQWVKRLALGRRHQQLQPVRTHLFLVHRDFHTLHRHTSLVVTARCETFFNHLCKLRRIRTFRRNLILPCTTHKINHGLIFNSPWSLINSNSNSVSRQAIIQRAKVCRRSLIHQPGFTTNQDIVLDWDRDLRI